MEYVLQKAGVVFQYDSRYTMLSYLNREVEIENQIFSFRKIKNDLLMSQQGIEQQGNISTIAIPERAFLDMLYLNGDMYFDNLNPLKINLIEQILPIYNSKTMNKRVQKILNDNGLE
jgi:CRISPR/Cas system-associated protein endoribonuclease Cas2